MTNLLKGWESNPNSASDEIAAANRAIVGGQRKTWDANWAYQMALSQGDPSKILAAEAALQAALAEDIRRRGGRHEDVMMMHRTFSEFEVSTFNKWLLVIGLAAGLYYFAKTFV